MLNWDDPLSKIPAAQPPVTPAPVAKSAEPQTLAASYATSEVIGDMSFEDTGVILPEVADTKIISKADEQLAETALDGMESEAT